MKKLLALLIAALLVLSMVACENNTPNETNDNTAKPNGTNSQEPSNTSSYGTNAEPSGTSSPDTDIEPSGTSSTPSSTGSQTVDKEYILGIIDQIYRAADGSVYKGYYLSDYRDEMIKQGKISEKSSSRYFGTTIEYEIAVYSEANAEAVAFSMCLLKVKNGTKVEQIKTAIKDNANPNKWECVTAESVVVESNGDYVILIMADTSEATALKNAFLSLNLE